MCAIIGYSFLSNQYGLTVDTVRAYELVLPNGTVTNVTESDSDLFWALKVSFVGHGLRGMWLFISPTREVSTISYVNHEHTRVCI